MLTNNCTKCVTSQIFCVNRIGTTRTEENPKTTVDGGDKNYGRPNQLEYDFLTYV